MDSHSRRVQLGLFAVLAIAVGRICFWAAVPPVTDTDVWWVAAAGRDLLHHHVLPRLNQYSFTDPLHPWTMHEWLFGPLYAWGLSALGPRFFSLFALLCACLTSGVLIAACLARSRDWRLGALLVGVVLLAFGMHLSSPRPPNVALFFPVAMAALAFAPRFGRRSLLLAILLELVWTNAHGSFALGPLLLLAGAAAEKEDRRRRLGAACLGALVTLVNPYGLALHRLVIGYALGAAPIFGRIHSYIVEFSPIWRAPAQVSGLERLALLALFALALLALSRAGLRVRGALALAFVALAVLAVRNLGLAGLVSAVVLAPALPSEWPGGSRRQSLIPRTPPEMPLPPGVLAAACAAPGLVILLAVQLTIGGFGSTRMIAPVLGGPQLVDLLQQVPRGARIFIPFRATGVALWYRPDPSVRVFYDARNDCYSPEVADTFFALDAGAGTDAQLLGALAHYRTDAAIVSDDLALHRALAGSHDWVRQASEGKWSLWIHPQRKEDAPSKGSVLSGSQRPSP